MDLPDRHSAESADPDSQEHEERRLIGRIARMQDVRALERLHAIYRPRMSGFLFRLSSDADLVEEVYNDVMFVVWQKAGQYNGESKVSTWLFAIAYRKAIKLLKKSQRRESFSAAAARDAEEVAVQDARHDLENRDLIEAALAKLPPKQRLIVELSYFADKTYEEIAEIAQCPVNTVKTRMFNARRKLNDVVRTLS